MRLCSTKSRPSSTRVRSSEGIDATITLVLIQRQGGILRRISIVGPQYGFPRHQTHSMGSRALVVSAAYFGSTMVRAGSSVGWGARTTTNRERILLVVILLDDLAEPRLVLVGVRIGLDGRWGARRRAG